MRPAKPTPKVFHLGGRDAILPREWLDAVDAPAWIIQGEAVAFALSKADLADMLNERGIAAPTVERLVKAFRLERDGQVGRSWQMLIDVEAVNPRRRGIYAAHALVNGSVVVRVESDGNPVRVARFDYDPVAGLSASCIPVSQP
jgi:hypothetical protein